MAGVTGAGRAVSRSDGKPPRLGVFIGFLDDSYQRAIWKSIVARAGERGAEVIGFFGHGLGEPRPNHATMNIAYRLAGPANVDACIVLSNTVGNFVESDGVARLVAGSSLPAVSIEFPLPGIPSVGARGAKAVSELVRHLVRVHGKKNLALVTGPERHADSIERETAFREALEQEDLALTDELLYRGRFSKVSGREAARHLLASGLPFDAVVCLNDYMAIGAMEEFLARGIAVPSHVAVTGFDDVEEARMAFPPLTTARQPLERFGIEAVDMALELLGGGAPQSRVFDCACSFRRSCGCPPERPLSESAIFREGADPELTEMIETAATSGVEELLRTLDTALAAGTDGSEAESISRLRSAVFQARRNADARIERASGGEGRAIDPFDQALTFLGRAEIRREARRAESVAERGDLLRVLSTRLLETFSPDALVRNWEECLRLLGFGRGFLVLFLPPVEPGGLKVPERSVLVSATPLPSRSVLRREFSTESLLPPELGFSWGKAGWLLEPLTYHEEPLGYILLEGGREEVKACEALRMEMSTAVKATLLMDEILEKERDLERLVEVRARELRETNEDLLSQIELRKSLEMEVQEISNRTMQSIGQDIHDDLCQHLVGISMLAAVMEDAQAATGAVPVESIREIRELLASAISRSRQFARTLYPPALDEFGFVSALEDLVETLGRASGGVSLSFQKEGDCRLEDPAKALQLYRILQEALTNALKHSGSDVVILKLANRNGAVVAEVRDFGKGLGIDGDGRGMGLRIMRYRAESIGARLEINNLDPGFCVSCVLEP
jgi:DNA-binding LacI/PurR family transcriptional regulator/signal transduction histidine kinase